jgi:hypothetical protein
MRTISIKGLVIAVLVTVLLDLVIVLGTILAARPSGNTPEELEAAILPIGNSTIFLVVNLVLGTLTTVVGGYIAARYGKESPIRNALAFGVIGVLVGWLLTDEGAPAWFNIPAFASILPASLLGGLIADRKSKGEGMNPWLLLACILALVVCPIALLFLLSGRPITA